MNQEELEREVYENARNGYSHMSRAQLDDAQRKWDAVYQPVLQKAAARRLLTGIQMVVDLYKNLAITFEVSEEIKAKVLNAVSEWRDFNRKFGLISLNHPKYDCRIEFDESTISIVPSEAFQCLYYGTDGVILETPSSPVNVMNTARFTQNRC